MKKNTYETLQETKEHGRPDFLFNIYPCTVPLDFSEVPVHWHDDVEFISVRKGKGIVELDFVPHIVSTGDIVMIRPSRLHAIKPLDGQPMEYENIMLHPNFMLSYQLDACTREYFTPFIEGNYQIPSIFRPDHPNYATIMQYIHQIDAICSDKQFAWQVGIKASLYSLFYTIFTTHPYQQPKEIDEKKYIALKEILSFVDANYTENITIETAAKQLGYSQSHFMRFFKQQTNMSFISYVNDYRLAKAADALTKSDASILEISGNCGYENLSLFNRQFKRKYQMTPSAFRDLYV